ncbi:MAG: ABC-three component system middle component 2 [Nitrospirales bacterium]
MTKATTFNGPLENGIRALAILTASYPISYDVQRLVLFDYITVHSGDVGGPESLHPPVPLRSGELLVRRELVHKGLLLMMSRGLIHRNHSREGIMFSATEESAGFLSNLQSPYLKELIERAYWVFNEFGSLSETEIREFLTKFFDKWTEEFHPNETSSGAGT